MNKAADSIAAVVELSTRSDFTRAEKIVALSLSQDINRALVKHAEMSEMTGVGFEGFEKIIRAVFAVTGRVAGNAVADAYDGTEAMR